MANLLAQRPPESLTNTGTLRIRGADGKQREKPVSFAIIVSGTNWRSVYEIANGAGQPEKQKLSVIHSDNEPNQYYLDETGATSEPRKLTSAQAMIPFGGSDFWLADLGLEFLHWPNQRVLRKELRRGQSCDVLESTNPTSQADGYVRVVSWIDIGSGGAGLAPIIHADAYEQDGRLLKQFDPKELKKVNGQWQLEEMEMRNRKTGSHTWIIFQLTPSSR